MGRAPYCPGISQNTISPESSVTYSSPFAAGKASPLVSAWRTGAAPVVAVAEAVGLGEAPAVGEAVAVVAVASAVAVEVAR
jgi:hypothetical protein